MPLVSNMLGVRVFFAMIVGNYEVFPWVFFYKTIIPLELVGYEIVKANSAPLWLSTISYLESSFLTAQA